MARFASAFWRRKGASTIAAICVAMLSSPGAVASQKIFGVTPAVSGGTKVGKPVAIDPATGMVTQLTPGSLFVGNTFDAVSSANTLYFVSDTSPQALETVDETTGLQGPIIGLSKPVMDMTVDPASGKFFGITPAVSGGTPVGKPVAIDPATGMVTVLTSGSLFVGNTFDAVSSANTLYFVSDTSPQALETVDETTGLLGPIIGLTLPVMDMTVAVTGASTVPEPPTALLLLLSLAGLIGIGRRRSKGTLTGDVVPAKIIERDRVRPGPFDGPTAILGRF